jgi:hypothetical protein
MAVIWVMSNPPREWPNVAKDVRDRAAEAAVDGIRTLEPLVMGEGQSSEERLRREARALNLFQRIARLLESVGAQTKP